MARKAVAFILALSILALAAPSALCDTGKRTAVSAPFEEWYSGFVGTEMVFAAGAAASGVSNRRDSIATAAVADGRVVVTPRATGDTTIRITCEGGEETAFDLYVYESRAQYDYLAGVFGGKTVCILGDSISTLEPYDTGASRYYDRDLVSDCGTGGAVADDIGIAYKDTYWGNILRRFGATLGVDEAIRGTTVVNSMESDERIKRLGRAGVPDIIIFYGGTNDARQKVSLDNYAEAYGNVLDKLGERYPDARLLALLPCNPAKRVAKYNALAIDICRERNVEYVNLANTGVRALHPGANDFSVEAGYILDMMYIHAVANGWD